MPCLESLAESQAEGFRLPEDTTGCHATSPVSWHSGWPLPATRTRAGAGGAEAAAALSLHGTDWWFIHLHPKKDLPALHQDLSWVWGHKCPISLVHAQDTSIHPRWRDLFSSEVYKLGTLGQHSTCLCPAHGAPHRAGSRSRPHMH